MYLFSQSIVSLKKPYLPALALIISGLIIELPVKAQSQNLISTPEIAQSSDAAKNEAIKIKAEESLNLLASGEYEKLRAYFAPELAENLTAENIKEIWQRSQDATGAIKKEVSIKVINIINADLVVVETEFEKTQGNFIITFNDKQQIVGMDFPKIDDIEQISQIFVESLAAKNYPKARGYLHPFLKTEVFPQQVQAKWEGLIKKNGQFKKIVDAQNNSGSGGNQTNLVIVSIEFEKATEDLFIIFDEERRIVGVDAPTIN